MTQKSQKGRLSAAQLIREVGSKTAGAKSESRTRNHSKKKDKDPQSNGRPMGKHRPQHIPRAGGVGGYAQDSNDWVATPGSPSLGRLKKIKARKSRVG